MNLFIDTNVYLIFYHFTNDDLEELKKLLVAIKDKTIIVYLPEQVTFEFKRNRESKIADALNKLNEQKLPDQFPQICKDYPVYKDLRASIRSFETLKGELIKSLTEDIKNKSLGADKIISDLFKKAIKLSTTEDILLKAKSRFDIGNPPGKDGSYGDAINWVSLLENVPDGEDLHLVVRDKDYISKIDKNSLSDFIIEEWEEEKGSKVYLYTSLSDFFSQHFPDIKLASEMERRFAISNFINSSSFAYTHLIIANLSKFADFSDREANEIIQASITNQQIYLIHEDEDVNSFLNKVLKGREKVINKEVLDRFNFLFNPLTTHKSEDADDDNLPF